MSERETHYRKPARLYALLFAMLACSVVLVARAVNLQVTESEFLQGQGESRFLREVEIPTMRGTILDRHGEPLAVSTPVESIWVNPKDLLQVPEQIVPLASAVGVEAERIERELGQRSQKEFVWLKRRVNPELADRVRELDIPGVFLQKEYRRFYPSGEATGHVLGFTNIDDVGQEGLELAYNSWLMGKPGSKRVIKDRNGRVVQHVELIREAEPGHDLTLTIDRRLQYLAYRGLKRTVLKHGASSGSVILMDVRNGQILAMANQPWFNPNDIARGVASNMRNRAITDVIEPGSVMKSFAVAAALESGQFAPDSPVDTSPGYLPISKYTIKDTHNYGLLDVTGVITKSSNVGATKLALSLEPEHLWSTYNRFGFGEVTGSGFPGESAGVLRNYQRWHMVTQATLSYGYGLSVTPLQLTQAYAAIANDGKMYTPTLVLSNEANSSPAVSVIDPTIARQVAAMLETVPGPEGTGKNARIQHYRVAGKTGTSHKSAAGGYEQSRYVSSFAGFAPASDPVLVCIVIINDPSNGQYYGGTVAAPLFSEVVGGALRLLDIPPDDYGQLMALDQKDLARKAAGGGAP